MSLYIDTADLPSPRVTERTLVGRPVEREAKFLREHAVDT
jgi:hypothetical protein